MTRRFNRTALDHSSSFGVGLWLAALSCLSAVGSISAAPLQPGGEFLLDTTVITKPADNIQRTPAVAFDGTNYFVVWQDYRDDGWHPHIYGTRVSPDGQILDQGGIRVAPLASSEESPAVTFDGRDFLVAWVQGPCIAAARVAPDGQVLDSLSFIVSNAGQSPASPALASNGGGSVVVWSDTRTVSDSWIYGARVSQDGAVLDTVGIPIGTTPGNNANPAISFGGASYLVAWDNQSYIPRVQDIRGIRLDTAARLLDSTAIGIDTADGYQLKPALAARDSGWMVVWQEGWKGHWDIDARRVKSDGEVADSQDITVCSAPGSQVSPRITADSLGYMVTWEDWRSGVAAVSAGRLGFNGRLLDSAGIVISSDTTARTTPAIASGSECLVVWCDARNPASRPDIYGSRVTVNGNVADTAGIVISNRANSQERPSVAFDGTNFLAVWTDYRRSDNLPSLYGVRITPAGTILDTAPFLISHAPGGQTYARVAFGGSYYLVAWVDGRTGTQCIYAARVSRAGVVIDTGGIAVSQSDLWGEPPDVACDGNDFLVVWNEVYTNEGDIRGARVSQAGTVLDPGGITICDAPHFQYQPSVAFSDSNYLVAWADERDDKIYSAVVFASRVSPQGEVLDPNGIRVSLTHMLYMHPPTVASDGRDWLVAWPDVDSGGIRATRVDRSGGALAPIGFAVSRSSLWSENDPVARWVASNYVVAWEDTRLTPDADIYAAVVNQRGKITDSFALVTQPGAQSMVSFAPDTGGHLLAAYTGWTDTYLGQRYITNRVWGVVAHVTGSTGLGASSSIVLPRLEVWPNPCRGILLIRATPVPGSGRQAVSVHDVAGRLIRTLAIPHTTSGTTFRLDLRTLSDGVYFLTRSGCTGDRVKIVVKR